MTQLSATGWTSEEKVTPFTIGETHVRYFHPQDRAAAQDLAAALDIEARDFVSFTPSPEEGYLELWLGGRGASPEAKPVITRRSAPAPVQPPEAPQRAEVPQVTVEDRGETVADRRGDWWGLRPFPARNVTGLRS
ncbi:hypothetical protein, partial [Paracoccus sp. (in: a-proteobacteria)]|uniref:hypothetical protein n=1 Tax=Paracoccus sp. TaxID=267 RepID=UPI00396CA24D